MLMYTKVSGYYISNHWSQSLQGSGFHVYKIDHEPATEADYATVVALYHWEDDYVVMNTPDGIYADAIWDYASAPREWVGTEEFEQWLENIPPS